MASIGLVWFVTLQLEPSSSRETGGAMILAGLLLSAMAAFAAWANKQQLATLAAKDSEPPTA